MALFAALFLLPLYYQGARGLSPLEAGLMMVPQGIGAAIMMPFAGRLTDRVGPGRVVLVGLALMLAGTLPFALAGSVVSLPAAGRGAGRPRHRAGRRDDARHGRRLRVASTRTRRAGRERRSTC